MKTISGKLISLKPISLSRAARNLSGFAVHENGASDAVSVYLKRAADAFNSLVIFHKELKNPHSLRKHRTVEESLDAEKGGIPESGEKSKHNPDFGVKIEERLEIELKTDSVVGVKDEKYLKHKRMGVKNRKETIIMEQIDEVGWGTKEKKHGEEKLKIEESTGIEQVTPDQVGEKRTKKKSKKETVKNEEPISDTEVRDEMYESGKEKKSKQESAGVEQKAKADETEEGSVKKKEKKKRKKRDGKEGETMEVEEWKSRGVDGGETTDLAKQSSKKERKRRKSERQH